MNRYVTLYVIFLSVCTSTRDSCGQMVAWMCPGGQAPQMVTVPSPESAVFPESTPQPQSLSEASPPVEETKTIITRFTHEPERAAETEKAAAPGTEFETVLPQRPTRFITRRKKYINPGVGVGTGTSGLVGPTATVDNVGWSSASIDTGAAGLSPTATQGAGGSGMP